MTRNSEPDSMEVSFRNVSEKVHRPAQPVLLSVALTPRGKQRVWRHRDLCYEKGGGESTAERASIDRSPLIMPITGTEENR